MESHPQNSQFRNNPETFHPCINRTKRVQWLTARVLDPQSRDFRFESN